LCHSVQVIGVVRLSRENPGIRVKISPAKLDVMVSGGVVLLTLTVLEQFGIVLAEELLYGCGSALFQSVESLDQAEDIRRHNQQIPNTTGTGIPKGVRRAAGDEHGGTGGSFDFVFAGLHAQSSFQHVPGFVVVVVNVAGSNQAWRSHRSTRVLPFGDDERIV
jgi:hypothetical protein